MVEMSTRSDVRVCTIHVMEAKQMVYHRTARSDEVRAASRAKILDAARTLFVERGYEATTMQEIVEAADTSIGNAYFYFNNKEQLFVELADAAIQNVWQRSRRICASATVGAGTVGALIYANVLEALMNEGRLTRLLFVTEPHAAAAGVIRDFAIEQWKSVLADNFPHLALADREAAAVVIFGINRGLVESALAESPVPSPARVARVAVQWALRGLGVEEKDIVASIRSSIRRARRQ